MADPVIENLELTDEEQDHFHILRKDGAIGYIIMNAPEMLNAFFGGGGMGGPTLIEALRHFEADNDIKCIVFKGLGRAFSTGGNVANIGSEYDRSKDAEKPQRPAQRDYLRNDVRHADTYNAMIGCSKVVIAEGKGYVLGVALDYFLAADFYICDDECTFGYPPSRMIGHQGVNPLFAMMRLGPTVHDEIFLMGRYIKAKELYARGAVHRSVPLENLEDTVRAAADTVVCQPADGLYIGKFNKRAAWEAMGISASGLVSAMSHALAVQQRLGPDEFNLLKARRELGTKGAFQQRDARYSDALRRYEEA